MAWWDSWLDWKPWSPWGGNKLWEAKTFEEFEKEYYNWMGVEMPTITTDQDHEVRLKRLELKYEELDGRLKYHSVNHYPTSSDRQRAAWLSTTSPLNVTIPFCCSWLRDELSSGRIDYTVGSGYMARLNPFERTQLLYCPKCGRRLYA